MYRRFKIYISDSYNPMFNLSFEEYLMKNSSPKEVILFLWQNENTIVIGRNQNPYKECDVKNLKEDGVKLVRRLSGGGSVYHDLGNLNFTFIAADENHSIERNMEVILNGISKFGVEGYFNGRNDLIVGERKFSGNAFISDNGMNCHHGTLLVDVDIEKLSKYLTVSPLKLHSKGIDSVTSRVINLKELSPDINISDLKGALISSFNNMYNINSEIIAINEQVTDLSSYLKKYKSWEWNYGESPDFSVSIDKKFNWGIIDISIDFSDGIIKKCKFYTDAILLEDFQMLEKNLCSKQYNTENVLYAIENSIINKEIKEDLFQLINNNLPAFKE